MVAKEIHLCLAIYIHQCSRFIYMCEDVRYGLDKEYFNFSDHSASRVHAYVQIDPCYDLFIEVLLQKVVWS